MPPSPAGAHRRRRAPTGRPSALRGRWRQWRRWRRWRARRRRGGRGRRERAARPAGGSCDGQGTAMWTVTQQTTRTSRSSSCRRCRGRSCRGETHVFAPFGRLLSRLLSRVFSHCCFLAPPAAQQYTWSRQPHQIGRAALGNRDASSKTHARVVSCQVSCQCHGTVMGLSWDLMCGGVSCNECAMSCCDGRCGTDTLHYIAFH